MLTRADAAADAVRFGNCGGWECYGGIIRPVYVELRAAAFIDSVRFAYQLAGDYQGASCKATVSVASTAAQSGSCELSLLWGKSEVATATKDIQLQAGSTDIEMTFDLKDLALWSPDEPNLYTLRAEVKTPSAQDRWSCRTGFREFKTEGPNFLLNGQRVVLNGVCRHDMWQDQGFTLSASQQEQDMRMIKTMGANFVRLVHYPHDRGIVELAEELGLLVSEEPGFWNMDFAKMPSGEIDLGCRILEGAIRRDWNSPAVVIWFLGNECAFPLSYLKRGKAICDQLDPIHRLVSVADLYGKFPAVRDVYDQAGLDFYDWHAYEFKDDKFLKLPESFGPGKPLTLTEWGWEDAGDGDIFYELDFDGLLSQVEARQDCRSLLLELERCAPIQSCGLAHAQRHPAFRSRDREPGDPPADLFQAFRSVCRKKRKLRCSGTRAARATSSALGSVFSRKHISDRRSAALGGLSSRAKILAISRR